jgi:ferredoxin--NADP+ reductase
VNNLGSPERALRVAVVGSGPSAFYAAEALFKSGLNVLVGMFEKLPSPFGLVRYGVAPDHQKIKKVTAVYEKTAMNPNFEYFGNVEIGKDLTVHQLRKFYDAVIFAYGAETDRKLGIVGEDLKGSYTATEFVAWYNGHPRFQDREFDLSCEEAAVIGQGNVALDVARILCKTADELSATDISQKALEQLAESKIRKVHLVGRRGPAQAAFTPMEIREFGELSDCAPVVNPADLDLNYSSQAELADPKNSQKQKNYEILKQLTTADPGQKSKRFIMHFRKSPAAMYGDSSGKLNRLYLEKNKLVGEPGQQKSMGTGEKEKVDCGILFRSVGYRGLPLEGVPYEERWGTIPNQAGRVMDSEHIFAGIYTTGWIKRGPSGVIGTNKPDSEETVQSLLADVKDLNPCKTPDTRSLLDLLKKQKVRYLTYSDWKKIDAVELERGAKTGKPREKVLSVKEMLEIISR